MSAPRVPHVLLVEDNAGDAALLQAVFDEGEIDIDLHVAVDGAEALDYLGSQASRSPDLVILDLNLPKIHGLDVLKKMKNEREWQPIPVVIMSTSKAPADIERAYELNANCFVQKPKDWDSYQAAIGTIRKFWLETAALPTQL